MKLNVQRRIAAKVLKTGENKVRFDINSLSDIDGAITRSDIRGLIGENKIWAEREKGISRARTRKRAGQKKKGRRSGQGSRKGTKKARTSKGHHKKVWIAAIRALRKKLREFKEKGMISSRDYRHAYLVIKSGTVKSKAHLEAFLKEHGMLKSKEQKTTGS